MAGMYPDNQTLEVFGKTVKWPGVDKSNGKFTNGDFNDPLVPPSCIPADTINLVVDNLNTFVTSMGGEPNNTEEEQLASLFSAAAVPFSGIKRDAHGRAQVAAPAAADDIARKAEVDAEAKARRDADTAEAKLRLETDKALQEAINAIIPVGTILISTAKSVNGYLPCNGAWVGRTHLYKLFAVIGVLYGQGDGVGSFALPDFRGCFLRGAGGEDSATRNTTSRSDATYNGKLATRGN